MSTAQKKKATAKRAANAPSLADDPPPRVAAPVPISPTLPTVLSPEISEAESAMKEIAETPGIAPRWFTLGSPADADAEIIYPPPRVTPGRVVQVTVEAYPSHIVTRPAIIVSTSALDSLINVHVFWDHFRDGSNLSPWKSGLVYCESEQPGTWRFPTRS